MKRPTTKPITKRIKQQTRISMTHQSIRLPNYNNHDKAAIAIIQPACYGDNINSTLMLQPIKNKYKDCVLDVWTSTKYGSAFYNNPHINNLYEIPSSNKNDSLHQVVTTPDLIKNCGYTKIFNPHPMVNNDKWTSILNGQFGTNLICAWIRALEEADIPYNVPLETVLRLTDTEINNAKHFCSKLNMNKRTIIMETEAESGQSQFNHHWLSELGKHLLKNNDTNLIISKRESDNTINGLNHMYPGSVYFAGGLSIRECAEVFNHCQIFFSVSSGLSNACNTNWCKKDIKWIEIVNGPGANSAPIRASGKTFYYENNLDGFINMLKDNNI